MGPVPCSDRRGRVLIGTAQREALVDEFDRSRLSAAAFCRLHGLTYQTFATWAQKRRRGESSSHQNAAPAFAEVVVEPRVQSISAQASALRITLPSGAVIELGGREQLPLAIELLRALETPRPC